jgi:hypothetical protein
MFGPTPGLETVHAEYQPFDRLTSSSIRMTAVNLLAMKEFGWRGEKSCIYF